MQKYWNTVQDEKGNPRYGASVSVQQNGVNSTIYTDSAGLIPAANPLTTDSTRGYFEFYAAAGTYDLVVFGVGFTSYTITAGANLGLPSGDVTFTQSGSGALTRTVSSALAAMVRTGDFSSLANAQTAGGLLTEQVFVNSLAISASSITANAGTSTMGIRMAGTLVAGSNSSYQIGIYSNPVFATGTKTGLEVFGALIDSGFFTNTGTGTIAKAYGVYIDDSFASLTITPTASAFLALGPITSGDWSFFSASTRSSQFSGPLDVNQSTVYFSMGDASLSVTKPGVQLFSTGNGGRVDFIDSAATANNRITEFLWTGGNFYGRFLNDANSAAVIWMQVAGGQALGATSLALTIGSGVATLTTTGLAVTGVLDILGTAASATASHLQLGSTTQSTIGANGAASALTANPLGYLIGYLGTTKIIIPYYNA